MRDAKWRRREEGERRTKEAASSPSTITFCSLALCVVRSKWPPSLIIYNEKDKGSDLNNCPSVAVAAAAAAAKCLSVFPSLNERGRRKTYARPPERARCPLVRAGALSKRTVIVILGNGFCKARRLESGDGGQREEGSQDGEREGVREE